MAHVRAFWLSGLFAVSAGCFVAVDESFPQGDFAGGGGSLSTGGGKVGSSGGGESSVSAGGGSAGGEATASAGGGSAGGGFMAAAGGGSPEGGGAVVEPVVPLCRDSRYGCQLCTFDSDCAGQGPDTICQAGQCKPPSRGTLPIGAPCSLDTDCANGNCFMWLGGGRRCTPRCERNADCGAGMVCGLGFDRQKHGCTPLVFASCPNGCSDAQASCEPLAPTACVQRCGSNTDCASGRCVIKESALLAGKEGTCDSSPRQCRDEETEVVLLDGTVFCTVGVRCNANLTCGGERSRCLADPGPWGTLLYCARSP